MTQFFLFASLIFSFNSIITMHEKTKQLSLKDFYEAQPELMKKFFALPKEIQCSTLTSKQSLQEQLWFEKQRFQHDDCVNSAQFNNNETLVLTASSDKAARIFKIQSGREVHRFQHNGCVSSAQFNNNETLVLTASYDGFARIFNGTSGDELQRFKHNGSVRSAQFNNNETLVITASGDGFARIFDRTSGNELQRLNIMVVLGQHNLTIMKHSSSLHQAMDSLEYLIKHQEMNCNALNIMVVLSQHNLTIMTHSC